MELKNKKVLLVGLGILGGGLSMAKYLISKGAKLKITDLRDKSELNKIINKLPKSISYTFGKHKEKDFKWADLVIFNPAVSYYSKWPRYCRKNKIPFFNDYTFFLESIKKTNPKAKIVGITGTRGKTTVATWTNSLIPDSTLAGNIPEKNLFTAIDKKTDIYVLELSSFQLEYSKKNK